MSSDDSRAYAIMSGVSHNGVMHHAEQAESLLVGSAGQSAIPAPLAGERGELIGGLVRHACAERDGL